MSHASHLRVPRLSALPILALILSLLAVLITARPAAAAETTLTATLTGEAEVPGPGSPNGFGTATVTLDPDAGTVCYLLTVDLGNPPTAAHIHEAPAGEAGPVVVPLGEPPVLDAEECITGVDAALIADIVANPANYYVNVHTEAFPEGAIRGQLQAEQRTVQVMVMKHNCADVTTTDQFEAVEARAATNPTTPDAAFGTTVETVLECPTVVLPGDPQTAGAVAGGESTFDFAVEGDGTLSADAAFMQGGACEPDVQYDANRNGTLDADVCLDLSHYVFGGLADGQVIVNETAPPAGFNFGTIRFTPGTGDEAALVSAQGGRIVLDMTADEDGMVMLHVYNFAQAAAATPAPTPTPAGGQVPDTAMPVNGSVLAVLLGLGVLLIGSLLAILTLTRGRRA